MSFVMFFMMGVIALIIIVFYRNSLLDQLVVGEKPVQVLRNASWFQNHWLGGMFLFFTNVLLFAFTAFCLYIILEYVAIPFLHLIVMFLATVASILVWTIIHHAWHGARADRLKMGFIGSSFYAFLLFFFLYKFITLKPAFAGDDTFMTAVGLIFGMIVATVAFMTCFAFTALARK